MKGLKLISIALFFIFIGCSNEENDTKELDCFDNSEQKFLDKAQLNFEGALKVYYKTEDVDKMYMDFLEEFSQMKFPPQFFINKPTFQIIDELNNNEFQSNYWASDSEEDAEMFLLYTNTESPWFSCLANNIKDEDLIETFNTMTEVTDLSPGLIASAFHVSLKNKELTKEVKILIAMTFFYQQSLTFVLNSE
jgi:hypothetical protein